MEEQELTRLPNEVVESYRQPPPGEVVETYTRPLPGTPGKPVPPPPVRRRSKRGLWIFLGCFALAASLAAAAFFWDPPASRHTRPDPFDYDFRDPGESGGPQEITIPLCPTGQGVSLPLEREHGSSLTAQEVYRKVNPAVVVVLADLGDGSASVGTGVLFTQDGYLITNYHVVEGGQACTVALDNGRGYEAKYVAGDADSDLAVLKVEGLDLPAAVFGDSDLLTVGDKVYAIGNPLGVELRGTLTDGIVSAIDRDVEVEGRTMTLLQTNAALNSGNSGGPLINEYGQVVGINTIKMMSEYDTIEGLGFAIPSSLALRWINELIAFGELQPQPVLGISIALVPTTLPDGNTGLEVAEITPGLSGDLAGVRKGDCVVAFNGQRVYSTEEILAIRRDLYVGDEVAIRVYRDGEYLDLTMTMMAE